MAESVRREHNSSPARDDISAHPAPDVDDKHDLSYLGHDGAVGKRHGNEAAHHKGIIVGDSSNADPDFKDPALGNHQNLKRGDADRYNGSIDIETDAEKGRYSSNSGEQLENQAQSRHWGFMSKRYRSFLHVFIFCLFTGWWIASLILHRHDKNWIVPFLLWLCITLRLLFFYVPISVVTRPMHFIWNNTGVRFANLIPNNLRIPAAAALTISVILIGAFVSKESQDNTRANRAISLFGLVVFLFLLWFTSRNKRKIRWHTVIVGMLCQFIIALFVLRTKAGYDIFQFVSELARSLLGFAEDGLAFLTTVPVSKLPWFLISVLPAIIFFVAFVQLLYYWGILQWFIGKFAVFFFWSMRVSGAEAVVAAASPFIGQGESAMLIRPFVAHLTQAELHQVMTSGFATIAGSVLVAYIGFGVNPQALISSCVMSIPASLAISKLRYPEEEESLTEGRVVIPEDAENRSVNALHAFANGAWLGLRIAGMILTTLLCIIALLGLIDGLLTWWGRYININNPPLTLELIVGYCMYPVAFLLGVSRQSNDITLVARLIGIKIMINEFVAYDHLTHDPVYANLSPRSRLIATYALCGFGNLGSLGTQIGVLSQIAPGRSGDVSRLALSALISGIISTLTSASIAGLLVTDQRGFVTLPSAGNSTSNTTAAAVVAREATRLLFS